MTRIHRVLAFFAVALVSSASGQIVITLQGKATSTALGWELNDVVTMTVRIEPGFVNGSTTFTAATNNWYRDTTSHDLIYSAATLTGTTGTYADPQTTADDPYSDIINYSNGASPDTLKLTLGADSSDIGLNTPNDNPIFVLQAYDLDAGFDYSFPATYTEPVEYQGSYAGSYTLQAGNIYVELSDSSFIEFNTTGYTLTISAIPEPSTYAFLAGLAGLAGAIWHRRRRVIA